MVFAGIFADSCSASYYLLKFCHRVDFLVDDDKAAGFAVNSGREQLAGGNYHGIFLLDGYKRSEFFLAVNVVACNADNIIGIFLHHWRIEFHEQISHQLGFLVRRAKNNCLDHFADFVEHFGDAFSHNPLTFSPLQRASKIFLLKIFFDKIVAVDVFFVVFGLESFQI